MDKKCKKCFSKSKNRQNSAKKCLKVGIFKVYFCVFCVFKKRKCAHSPNYYTTCHLLIFKRCNNFHPNWLDFANPVSADFSKLTDVVKK